MAITGQTDLTSINTAKELEVGYQPLHLVEITFQDGFVLRLASENLDGDKGGIQYDGHNWLPRLNAQSLDQISSISNNGIVQSPSVTLTISDANHDILTTCEDAAGRGFKGAKMRVTFLFWDPGTSTFSSDSKVVFVGICDPPSDVDDTSLHVRAVNLLNMARKYLPTTPVQTHCPWVFPVSKAQRIQAAVDQYSSFFRCGYSPDVSDTDVAGGTDGSRGNYESGTTPFTDCGKTWEDCIARLGDTSLPTSSKDSSQPVQIEQDQSGRHTGRFGGIHYSPPLAWQGRNYESGDKTQGSNNPNLAKFNDYYPMIWGKSFVDPIIMNIEGDPNSTRFEVVLCAGTLSNGSTSDPIEAVLVNGYEVPRADQSDNVLFRWQWINGGARDGKVNNGTIFDGKGDPYGSLASMVIVVPLNVADSSSTPTVKVLTQGGKIRVWNSNNVTDFTLVNTTNPVWILADMLMYVGFTPADLNLSSFIREAAYADEQIAYQALDGTIRSHERFRAGMAIRERRTAAEILTEFLASFLGQLRTADDGTLEVLIKKPMNLQQSSAVDGSNNQAPINNGVGGVVANSGAYSAYDFDESNIVQGSFKMTKRPITDTPNKINVSFQDEEQNFVGDTLTVTDSDDIYRAGQEIQGSITASGLLNYDQAGRILRSIMSEQSAGNIQGDTRGTMTAQFKTTHKAIRLKCGDLITVKFSAYGLAKQAFRVTGISPSQNYEEVGITATWNDDAWQEDASGSGSSSFTPVSATLKVLTSHTAVAGGGTGTATTGLPWGSRPEGFFSGPYIENDGSAWTLRTSSMTLGTDTDISSLIVSFLISGTIGGSDLNPPDEYKIYDCYIDLAYPDGSTDRFRATRLNTLMGESGVVTDAKNILDGDTSNYADITRATISVLDNPAELQISGFTSLGFVGSPETSGGSPRRAPYGWCPNTVAPTSADALKSTTEKTFQLSQGFTTATDGSSAVSAIIKGQTPVNMPSSIKAPVVTTVNVSTSSGTVPAGAYWISIASVDSSGVIGPLSNRTSVTLSAAGSISVDGVSFDPSTSGWNLYMGTSQYRMSLQTTGLFGDNPSVTAYKVLDQGPPDPVFSRLSVEAVQVRRSGIWLAAASVITATTIKVTGAGWTTNQWANRIVSIIGKGEAGQALPVGNFTVASNTADTLTLSGSPDLTALGAVAGDFFVMRATGAIASSTTIGDPDLVNSLPNRYAPVNISSLTSGTPVAVKTSTPHGLTTGNKAEITGIGQWTVTVVDALNFTLDGSTPSNATSFPGVGQVQRVSFGLVANEEVGKSVVILYGTGAGQKRVISSNTTTTVTVSQVWDVTPDATSVWAIVEGTVLATATGPVQGNSDPTMVSTVATPLGNVSSQVVMVTGYTTSSSGAESLANDSPFREIYVTGAPAPDQQLFLVNGV